MKKLFMFLFFTFTLTTVFAQQASLVGKWSGQFPNPDGTMLKFTMTITEDAYHFDFGSDGTNDASGGYTSNGVDKVTIWDTAGQNICPSDQKGIYTFALNGDSVTFTKVSDPCAGRGDAPMTLKRL